jgi:predicted esterase
MVGRSDLGYVLRPHSSTHIHRFDIISFDFTGREDQTGVLRMRDEVNKLIAQEITEDLPPNRIVVGGFSQGGAMALATGLSTPHKLAGLTVLSGWFSIREKIKEVCGNDLVLALRV